MDAGLLEVSYHDRSYVINTNGPVDFCSIARDNVMCKEEAPWLAQRVRRAPLMYPMLMEMRIVVQHVFPLHKWDVTWDGEEFRVTPQ